MSDGDGGDAGDFGAPEIWLDTQVIPDQSEIGKELSLKESRDVLPSLLRSDMVELVPIEQAGGGVDRRNPAGVRRVEST